MLQIDMPWFGSSSSNGRTRGRVPVLLCGVLAATLAMPAAAATFTAGTSAELVAAINAANATPAEDAIRLTADIPLSAVDHVADGPNALPGITTAITLYGDGHALSAAAPNLRLLRVESGGTLRLFDVELRDAQTTDTSGAAVYSQGTLELTGVVVAGNEVVVTGNSTYVGGAILATGNSLVVAGSRFENNRQFQAGITGGLRGGAIGTTNLASAQITNSTFTTNEVEGGATTGGGAIALETNTGPALLVGNTFDRNRAAGTGNAYGGALYVQTSSTTIRNNTFSGNAAEDAGAAFTFGGAIYYLGTTHVLNFNSFVGNAVTGGSATGAAVTTQSVPTAINIANNLFAENTGSDDCTGVTLGSVNASDGSCPGSVPAPVSGVDVAATLASNGGPTQTHALPAGSAMIDAADFARCAAADQRGFVRDAKCDIGAFEYSAGARALPTVQFASASASYAESSGTATVTLSVAGASGFLGTARVHVLDLGSGTAAAGSDYTDAGVRVLTIDCAAGCPASVSFSVALAADAMFDAGETIAFRLATSDGGAVLGAQRDFTATITDAATVTVTATDASATEVPADNGRFTIDLGVTNATGAAIPVAYSIGGSASSGVDYTALSGTASIASGQQTALVDVVVIDDAIVDDGETVTVTLTGSTTTGVSVNTTPATVTIADGTETTVPGAPASPVATAGDGSASIAFTAPADGGSPITGYTATSNPGGFTSTGCTMSPCVVNGLANGTAYTFTVTATNAIGTGAASAASNSVTPAGVPGAPTSPAATAGNTSASISFVAPSANGSPITGYTATSNPGGFTSTGCTMSPCVVNGLTNGVAYTFTVTATNAVGTGAPSAASNSVTPAAVPDAPTNVTAIAGNAQAMVSWTAPSGNGSAITGYTATASPGGAQCTSMTTGCTISGLANGTAYTFTVTATNTVGASPASAPSASVTPSTVPGAPQNVTAVAGNMQATVSWIAPASNGGAAITGYTVTAAPGGAQCTTAATSCMVSGLSNGTAYTFTVVATNLRGDGAPSTASTAVTPAAVPGAPTGVQVVVAGTTATIQWIAPADTGGSPITGYTVTAQPGGLTCTTTGTQCTITGLQPGTTYTFAVTASNGAGIGPPGFGTGTTPAVVLVPVDDPLALLSLVAAMVLVGGVAMRRRG